MNFWKRETIELRGIEPEDWSFFLEMNQSTEIHRMLDFLAPPLSKELLKQWCAEQSKIKFQDGSYRWIIEDSNNNRIGVIDTQNCDSRNGTFSYGVVVLDKYRRNGIAKKAILCVMEYYFLHLRYNKANIIIHADNLPSLKLHESLGFQKEGELRDSIYTNGKFINKLYFGQTKDEFIVKWNIN